MSQIECKICGKKLKSQGIGTHVKIIHNLDYKKDYLPKYMDIIFESTMKMCMCGCEKLVNNNWGQGHWIRKNNPADDIKNRYKMGAGWRGKKQPKELIDRRMKTMKKNGKHALSMQSLEVRKKISNILMGHPGIKHTEETKQKMRENHPDQTGVNNPFYGKTHSEETLNKIYIANTGMTKEEYKKTLPEKEKYYRKVKQITNKQPIHLLENYDKLRGNAGVKGSYQLDHIIPKSYGFKTDIDPEIIGDINNLQFISWELNNEKSNNYEEGI